MLLYHGSHTGIETPKLALGRENTDFGKGFYTTLSLEQAEKWAKIKKEREKAETGYVSVYEIEDELFNSKEYKVYLFNSPSEDWLNFVVSNRRRKNTETYDLVMGPVANDRLYATITLYEQGILSASACIEQLQTHKLFDQLSFHSEKAINKLRFIKTIKV